MYKLKGLVYLYFSILRALLLGIVFCPLIPRESGFTHTSTFLSPRQSNGLILASSECSSVVVVIVSKMWANEIRFETEPPSAVKLESGEVPNHSTTEFVFDCVLHGTYTFVAIDTFGDGWHGGI